MAKTFVPTLLTIVHKLCVYISRYRMTIRENLPDEQAKDGFDVLADACTAFLDLMEDFNAPI